MMNIREKSQPIILAPLMITNLVYYTSFLAAYYLFWANIYIVKGMVFPIRWTQKMMVKKQLGPRSFRRTKSSPGVLESYPVTDLRKIDTCREKTTYEESHLENDDTVRSERITCDPTSGGASPETTSPAQHQPLSVYQRSISTAKHVLSEAASWINPNLGRGKMTVYHFAFMLSLVFLFAKMHLTMLIGRGVFKVNPRTLIKLYSSYPLKPLSRLWGYLNKLEIPVWLRAFAFSTYSRIYGAKIEEAEVEDLTSYPNLCSFFQRSLKAGIRPVADVILTSPADGRVLHSGPVNGDLLEQVKGVTYSLEGFFGPSSSAKDTKEAETDPNNNHHKQILPSDLLENPSNRLYQCIIYLAPGDYHRFHSPADWTVFSRRHFPGELFSVQPSIARWLKGLFSLNERVVYRGKWEHGFFSYSPVGAVNVGSINVNFDQDFETNTPTTYPPGTFFDASFPSGHNLNKGELVGDFNLGSTVVLIFEAPSSFDFNVAPGCKVQCGQALGSCGQ